MTGSINAPITTKIAPSATTRVAKGSRAITRPLSAAITASVGVVQR
jgi:hypothetical protein